MAVRLVNALPQLKPIIAAPTLTVVDMFAEWCGPCKQIAPMLNELATQKPNVTFLKVDVDEAQDIAQQYRISAMPTFVFFKNGEEVERIQGADYNRLKSLVDSLGTAPPLPEIPDDEKLSSMSVKELMGLAKALAAAGADISRVGLIEKSDVIDALKKHRK